MMEKNALNQLYRMIPKVDALLMQEEIKTLIEKNGHGAVMEVIRRELDEVRDAIRNSGDPAHAEAMIRDLPSAIERGIGSLFTPNVRKVINGTGTILHTNLGRAPISYEQAEKLKEIVSGYCNLEYNLEAGARGERYSHFEELIRRITGAEAAMVVNNNAAAVLLILSTMAKGGEVIVSRGELVEIGGKFRIPDVMEQSGAYLREVGTTNKTHLDDYLDAVTENTRALLKVHTSNYRIMGFTESVPASELKKIGEEHGIPVIEDLGSGVLVNLEKYGLAHEPTVQEAVEAGVDVICFSGDKLLGGPQAGIIIGKKQYIAAMKKNPLTRAVRVDKFTVTALELALLEYLNPETVKERIPVLKMMSEPAESVKQRGELLLGMMREKVRGADLAMCECRSQIGGGSLPTEQIASWAVVIRPHRMSIERLEESMRHMPVPVIGRVQEDAFWLDVRTIDEREFETVAKMFGELKYVPEYEV